MSYDELKGLVSQGLSIREIASETSSSYTNVRYWLRRHKLKTKKLIEYKCACGEVDPKKFYGHKRHVCGKCQNAYVIRKGKETRDRIIAHLGGECKHCGYNTCSEALDVHHTNPKKKDPNFGSIRGWSWKRIEKELQDCVLLCKNHHTEHHAGILILEAA